MQQKSIGCNRTTAAAEDSASLNEGVLALPGTSGPKVITSACQQQIHTCVPPVWHSESGGRRSLQPDAASAGSPSLNNVLSLPGHRRHTAV